MRTYLVRFRDLPDNPYLVRAKSHEAAARKAGFADEYDDDETVDVWAKSRTTQGIGVFEDVPRTFRCTPQKPTVTEVQRPEVSP